MRWVITISLWLLLAGIAAAQSPPNGVPCNAIGSTGAVKVCFPGVSYGCQANQTSSQLLGTDGNRTSIQFQNLGGSSTTLTFGDNAIFNVNGWQVQPGNSYMWSNIGRGNEPGRVATSSVNAIANGANACVFMFSD